MNKQATIGIFLLAVSLLVACSSDSPSESSSDPRSAADNACIYYEYTLCQESARCAVTRGLIGEPSRDDYVSRCYVKRARLFTCEGIVSVAGDVNVCVDRLQSATCEGYVRREASDPEPDLPLPTACHDLSFQK